MSAFVFAVIRRATSAGSRFSVAGLDVGEDGRRADPGDRLGRGVERERRADRPRRRRRSRARRARARSRRCRSRRRSSAATPSCSAASRSKPSTSGPKMKRPLSSVRSKAAFSSGIERRVLRLDVNVRNRHYGHGNRPAPPDHEVDDPEARSRRRSRLHVDEIVVHGASQLEPTAQPIPANTEQKTAIPTSAESRKRPQADLEDPGGDRHERADERRRERRAGPRSPRSARTSAPPGDSRRGDVDVAAVALEQRMAAAEADPPAAGGAERVAGDPRRDDGQVRREARLEVVPEQRDLPGERARGERAAVEHRQLARRREARRRSVIRRKTARSPWLPMKRGRSAEPTGAA